MEQTICWGILDHAFGRFHLAASAQGLCAVILPNGGFADLQDWTVRHIPGAVLRADEVVLAPYRTQLLEYLAGERKTFDLPLDLRGTAFQRSVWQALTAIPYGSTCAYSAIACAIGHPAAIRAVGAANGQNPIPVVIPCHRVIGKNGALTGFGGGLPLKKALLALEGWPTSPGSVTSTPLIPNILPTLKDFPTLESRLTDTWEPASPTRRAGP